ncbi:cytosine methyltransferase [Pluralibacter gergoviae]|uniref:DNA cytosine methyltransferase n=1 Tax=Pluralibacter gergoviae TaxID=61647 RepID=UPI00065DB235|nr:DNA cytosine methyltransferase [Pluralibacter gergoviae]KMK05869.1 cytosine methyltransferase [Pluralibacter gergoviae]KMK09996.1 cytosine methyltransferase [Pluralibacter gergoviae]KMK29097.1 cytosine methyltransferase [Pluralibacter gergoviae]
MHKAPNVIDLFSGCGGFGLGAKLAGFNVIAAIDIDSTLQSAYGLNFPKTQLINADISTMRKAEWSQIIGDREVDGIIGGPPCQGYSRMGHSDANDPRRSLLRHFFRTINIIRPKFFVMENVEGLMDSKNVYELKSALKTLDRNYKVLEPMILDASDFGAPTKRKRVVVIGFVDEDLDLLLTQSTFAPRNIKKTCVRDAIYDLCSPISKAKSDDALDYGWSGYRTNFELSTYAKEMRKMPSSGLGCKLALDKFKAGQVSGFFNTIHSLKVKERYSSTAPGTSDPISKSKRLTWDGLCPTLRAGTGADKGSHQAVRPLHPQEGRVITVREAARLQGFPDWFIFHQAKWHSFRMIGNSVSPIMSKHIMGVLFEALKEKDTKNKKVG